MHQGGSRLIGMKKERFPCLVPAKWHKCLDSQHFMLGVLRVQRPPSLPCLCDKRRGNPTLLQPLQAALLRLSQGKRKQQWDLGARAGKLGCWNCRLARGIIKASVQQKIPKLQCKLFSLINKPRAAPYGEVGSLLLTAPFLSEGLTGLWAESLDIPPTGPSTEICSRFMVPTPTELQEPGTGEEKMRKGEGGNGQVCFLLQKWSPADPVIWVPTKPCLWGELPCGLAVHDSALC